MVLPRYNSRSLALALRDDGNVDDRRLPTRLREPGFGGTETVWPTFGLFNKGSPWMAS
jgi:hypothetical protein